MNMPPDEPVPSPFMPYLHTCDSCGREVAFIEVVEDDGELYELHRCACGDTEELRDVVTNDKKPPETGVS